MKKCISIKVYGKVQGVWFRASTRNKANEIGVNGYVRNEADGSVYIEASGTEAQLQNLADWCKEGPPHAEVSMVEVDDLPFQEFEGFKIDR